MYLLLLTCFFLPLSARLFTQTNDIAQPAKDSITESSELFSPLFRHTDDTNVRGMTSGEGHPRHPELLKLKTESITTPLAGLRCRHLFDYCRLRRADMTPAMTSFVSDVSDMSYFTWQFGVCLSVCLCVVKFSYRAG